jgi:redox-sensitive bicupin YhaK (pirin superfamily)
VSSRIELEVPERARSIDGFPVARILPSPALRALGPFVFVDHMGPAVFGRGSALDVRPHPHIHLATVTYLLEGSIFHRDSLGSARAIQPGAINWMHAGRGIVHSERSPQDDRDRERALHGLQLWVALPTEHEESEPGFAHHPASSLPRIEDRGVRATVLAGQAYGQKAPADVRSPLFYLDIELEAGAQLELPREYSERGIFPLSGELEVGGRALSRGALSVLSSEHATVRATTASRFVALGGESLGPRYIWWNFVSSSKERILEAANEWRGGRFPSVPGDEHEFIPLDTLPSFSD